jgi:uncharacterized protein
MRLSLMVVAAATGMAFGSGPARAQAFDCTKAKTPIEKAICATPVLQAQDKAMSEAFAATIARDPARAEELRKEQRLWLATRDKTCAPPPDAPPAKLAACLAGAYRARLIALKVPPTQVPNAPPNAQAASQPTPKVPGAPPVTPAATPPKPAPLPPVPLANATPLTAPAVALPAVPPLPAVPVSGQAELAGAAVPANAPGAVLLTVKEPGRFAVKAKSKTGVAVQLVDMVTGPAEAAGDGGMSDGRIDVLLDRGVYKLRTTGAEKATGEAVLTVEPFSEAAKASTALFYGGESSGDLGDLQQRSFWLAVGADGKISIEALGRHVADLRLWRNGRDLVQLDPDFRVVEVQASRPVMRARLEGKAEPGVYLATVYGGPGQRWTNGEEGRDFHIRSGAPEPAFAWTEGVIGPFGSVRFALPTEGGTARLELPEPAAARITVAGGGSASILRTSREPVALLAIPSGSEPKVVEIAGAQGQPFRLRLLQPQGSLRLAGSGPHLVFADVAGEGGDEIPAAAVLARFEGARGRVIAADAPRVGPGQAWRRSFNFRGTTTMPFEVTAATAIAVQTQGPGLKASIEPLVGNTPLRADGKVPSRFDLDAGWYRLKLEPVGDAAGVVDVTLGPPGLQPERLPPAVPRPAISFGTQVLDKDASYQVFASAAPGLQVAPGARALPVLLDKGALTLVQEPGQGLSIPVKVPDRGALAAEEVNGVPVPVELADDVTAKDARTVTIRLPAPDKRRAVVLSWSDPQAMVPKAAGTVPTAEALPVVQAGTAQFSDLEEGTSRSFRLDVAEGGLYRIETLGRLKTGLTLSTAFRPGIDKAEANGAGLNALLQTYARAGRYLVTVNALEGTGRLGLSARPAPLAETAALLPSGSVRASLAQGKGVVIPLEIATAGLYRLTLDGLDRIFRARLEDAEGWPLTTPGPTTEIARRLEPGRYRLVVLPEPVDARVVARLDAVVRAPDIAGHGPHALPFDLAQRNQWREPAGRDEPREPDIWTFALAGPADVTLDIGDGMVGELKAAEGDPVLGRMLAKSPFKGTLQAGRYRVEARSLGRNDRLDYTLVLNSAELQPGAPRRVSLPATIPFAIAERRVVNLTSFGRTDLRAILRDAAGRAVERLDDRSDDWNIALSRVLDPGRYTLELSRVDAGGAITVDDNGEQVDESGGNDAMADASSGEGEDRSADSKDGESRSADASGDDQNAGEADAGVEPASAALPKGTVELRLALPEPQDAGMLALSGFSTVLGPQVHRFALPKADAGGLVVLTAASAVELVLAVEAQTADGWATVGTDRGLAPLVAIPADAKAGALRAALWSVDGGSVPATVAARVVREAPQDPGRIAFTGVPLDGFAPLQVALVHAPGGGLLAMAGDATGLLDGSSPGRALAPAPIGILVPQSDAVWLAARSAQGPALTLSPVETPAGALALVLPEDGAASIPAASADTGTVRVWTAETPFGQPGLDAGQGMGIAAGSTLALAGAGPLRVWNASDRDVLRLRLLSHRLAVQPVADGAAGLSVSLSPRSAQPVRLPAGAKRVSVDLTPGTAAIAGSGTEAVTVWTAGAPVTRSLEGAWTELLLANTGDKPASVRLSLAPSGGEATLTAGSVLKRFFGAAGSFALPVESQAGDRIVLAGAEGTFLSRGGRVSRGRSLAADGPGLLTVDHPEGLVALWIERPGRSPWPSVAPVAAAAPATLPLAGPAMTLALKPATPVLLTARTTAPVIAGLEGTAEAPELFPSGAAFSRYLPAGEAVLTVYSPHDGPLSGTLELTTSPVVPAGEGVGEAVAVAPGGSVTFGFEVRRDSTIGIGVRADPDRAAVRLLDAAGHTIGEGVTQLRHLAPGRYVLEARVPADASTTTIRPALLGLSPPPAGPPAEIAQSYLERAGLKAAIRP